MSGTLLEEIADFIYQEAELLDQARYRDWLDIIHPEGLYWVPAAPDQPDPDSHVSIVFEDRPLLALRIGRLEHPMAHGLASPIRTSRVVGNLRLGETSRQSVGGVEGVEVASRFQLVEWQNERQRLFAGRLRHRLVRAGSGWLIRDKRVDLVNAEGAFESIQFIF